MNILLANDDGYNAAGLRCLASRLRPLGQVTIVAPDRNRSGASNSLTLDRPLRVTTVEEGVYAVNGTPTDCVIMGVRHVMYEKRPDLILSGVNMGQNLAEDVTYSGTIAAAFEGTLVGGRDEHLALP
mgnify:CR=1 FL=1